MPLSLQFCPQPRCWLQWRCTVGVSLGPAPDLVHSQVRAATPVCRLMEKVRWEDLAWCLTKWLSSALVTFLGPLGRERGAPPGSCPVRAGAAEQVWGSSLLKMPFGFRWALLILGLRGWRWTEGDPQRGSQPVPGSPRDPGETLRAPTKTDSAVPAVPVFRWRIWSDDLSSFRPVPLQAWGWL